MYSKQGRQSASRFLILKHKEEILAGKVKKVAPKKPQFGLHRKYLSPNTVRQLIEESVQAQHTPNESVVVPSSNFKAQSRQQFYQARNKRSHGPSAYNCKYEFVHAKVIVPNFDHYSRANSASRSARQPSEITPGKPRKRVSSGVGFAKQLPRPSSAEPVANQLSYPQKRCVEKRCSTPDFRKYRTRNTELVEERMTLMQYSPSYKLVSADLGKVPNFDQYLERQPMIIEHLVNSRTYKPNYSSVERRVSCPDFTRGMARPCSAGNLPEHMTSVNSRIALDTVSEKMLEMNNSFYVTGRSRTALK